MGRAQSIRVVKNADEKGREGSIVVGAVVGLVTIDP
jgi:hypothetical protein